MIVTSTDIPTIEPTEITAGDTARWTRTVDATFSATLGFSLSYKIIGMEQASDISSTGSGTLFTVSLLPADTGQWITPGLYPLKGWISKAGARYPFYDGKLTVFPNPASQDPGEETRSDAKIVLDAILEVIKARATRPEAQYQIEGVGRHYIYKSDKELRDELEFWQAAYRRELAQDAIRRGETPSKNIGIRFNSVW